LAGENEPLIKKAIEMTKGKRDIEISYPAKQFVQKLRRLADAIENGKRFQIQIARERVSVPSDALFNIEHERSKQDEEIEFQLKWKLK
jgi:amphi-Trp domain-containing protein